VTDSEQDLQGLDELEEDEAVVTEEEETPPAVERRRIFTDKSDPPVSALHANWKEGDLILDPIFQRRKVWDDSRSSRLIESAILEVPLPVFYLAESPDGTQEVIDGQQRLTAFFRFLDNDYTLRGLKALPQLNGKHYRDLDKPTRAIIRQCALRTVLFKKESDENLRFEIFERLNTGAVPLNAQELRNCIYRGRYNELLCELSCDPDYMRLMNLKTPEKRMRDVEYVLRFGAFYHATYLKYKPSMARFLNLDMEEHQNITPEKAEKLRSAFKTSVTLIWSLLGTNAFKRYYRGEGSKADGYWEPRKFNAALYDILMWGFADADKSRVMASLDAIREALMVLMTENDEFVEAIELSTSSFRMVTRRFDLWRATLSQILNQTSKQPRCFPRALKESLYDADPTCKICGQHISAVDDTSIDHFEQYWLGGKTELENARLAHRYCNWARSKHDPGRQAEAKAAEQH
jgi:hypothetical protein